jgi:RHH-type proline utilization regulon transcriptional repressor/proline dehydrogenase/delta 1-pyrroline-5-carboxylate dehydrogenase
VVEPAIALARRWASDADDRSTRQERRSVERLAALLRDHEGLSFATAFLDRVARAERDEVAAAQLATIVRDAPTPSFLSPVDRLLLTLGAKLGPRLPGVVVPAARARLRQLVGHLVVDAGDASLTRHLAAAAGEGRMLNLNLLGEAVLGEKEAQARRDRTLALVRRDDVDYVSVKVSSIVSQLEPWDHAGSVARVVERLRPLYEAALTSDPPVFVNLDLEDYRDLDLTVDVFTELLEEERFLELSAGIVLQAYLPDAEAALERLIELASRRAAHGGGELRIRLVKGANLSMENVDAALHGWTAAPYQTKADTDANMLRLLDQVLIPEHLVGARIGLASHNLFDVAFGVLLAEKRGVAHRLDVEMLQGMSPGAARAVQERAGPVRLYTPIVAREDFDVAVAYLVRRLEELASPGNFLRAVTTAEDEQEALEEQATAFRAAAKARRTVSATPRRQQDPHRPPRRGDDAPFVNEPDTDPALAVNRAWAEELTGRPAAGPNAPLTDDVANVDEAVARARAAAEEWQAAGAEHRRRVLLRAADELAARRGDLIAAMMTEAGKPIAEGDPEVSEAIDFARYYANAAPEVDSRPGARFEPIHLAAITPPWNFPVAIPIGGVLAALAAGAGVIFKPAPETPRCAEIAAEACWAAGISNDLLAFLRIPDGDVGRHLITHPGVDAVVLTGAFETAKLFRSWRPDLKLLGETSGKNALVVTPNADLDLAVADLVRSAFGHGGQKCSAASLGILVGDVATSARFRRQLIDAVESIQVGPATDLSSRIGPLIAPPSGPLERAVHRLEPGERWLVEPRPLDDDGRLWSPGVKEGVAPGSHFHLTECFGPVLGLMAAADIDEALELQHAPGYGLTGGLHSLDRREIDHWLDRVEVGNAYVNRHSTGAIVQRQSFGGWKRSSIGPGAKTGGPNYLPLFGTYHDDPDSVADGEVEEFPPSGPVDDLLRAITERLPAEELPWLRRAAASDERAWQEHFGLEHDPSALQVESNVFRYRAHPKVVIRATEGTTAAELARALVAAVRTGAPLEVSAPTPGPLDGLADADVVEPLHGLLSRLEEVGDVCLRVLGSAPPELLTAAEALGIRVVPGGAVTSGRVELARYLREQAVSRTRHRYGRLDPEVAADAGIGPGVTTPDR